MATPDYTITIVPGLSLNLTNNSFPSTGITGPVNILFPSQGTYKANVTLYDAFFPAPLAYGGPTFPATGLNNMPIVYVRNASQTVNINVELTEIGGVGKATMTLSPQGYLFLFNTGNTSSANTNGYGLEASDGLQVRAAVVNGAVGSPVEIFLAQ